MSDENIVIETSTDIDVFDEVVETGDFDEAESIESSEEIVEETESSSEQTESKDTDLPVEEESSEDNETEGETSEGDEDKSDEDNSEKSEDRTDGESEEVEEKTTESSLNDDTEIEVKVDGEVEKVSLQELKNNYSGKQAWDKKFTELDRDRQAYKNDLNRVNGYVTSFSEKMKEGNALEAMQYLGKFAGIPPYMVKEQLLEQALPELLRRQELSPQELQQELLDGQREHLKEQQESENTHREAQQTQRELRATIDSYRETHKISNEEWDDALQHLDETLPQEQAITPDDILDMVIDGRRVDTAIEVLGEFDISSEEAINQLADVQVNNPNFTKEDLKEVVKIALDQEKNKATEAKMAAKAKKQKATKTVAKQTKQEAEPEVDPDLEDFFF